MSVARNLDPTSEESPAGGNRSQDREIRQGALYRDIPRRIKEPPPNSGTGTFIPKDS